MSTSGVSSILENSLLDHVNGVTSYTAPVTTIYMALLTTAPSNATTPATMVEATYTGYARKSITIASDLNAATGTAPPQITNANAITFVACSGSTSTVIGWALVENATGTAGRVLWFGGMTSQVISSGITFSVPIGNLVLQLPEASGLGGYAALHLLDLSVGRNTFTMPTMYMTLATAATATSYTEGSYTGYTSGALRPSATAQMTVSTGNAPATATNGTGQIVFPASTGGSLTVTNYVMLDSATIGAGNILWYGTTTSQAIASGNTPTVATSALSLSIT